MRNRTWSDIEAARFGQKLAQLLYAGIPLLTALRHFEHQFSRRSHVKVFHLIDDLQAGYPLSVALSHIRCPPFFCFLVIAAEHHGQLAESLEMGSNFYFQRLERKKKYMKALAYPSFVLLTSLFALYFLLSFLLPQFISLYETFHAELPLITKLLIRSGRAWVDYKKQFVFILVSLLLLLFWMGKQHERVERWLLRTPILSKYFRLYLTSFFCTQVGILLEGGLPILKVCRIFMEQSHIHCLQEGMTFLEAKLLDGASFSQSVKGVGLFSQTLIDTISIAEETGSIASALIGLGKQLEQDLELFFDRSVGLFESLLILCVGGIVFGVMAALFIPLMGLIHQL
jgi:type II secretory pathway component PulF